MTKADLVEKTYLKTNLTKKESGEIVEHLLDLLKSTLEGGGKIKIAGFGNFEVKEKSTRRGRNPQTGTTIEITARRVLTFNPSQVLRQSINDA